MSDWDEMVKKLEAACDYQRTISNCAIYDQCQGQQDCLWCSEVIDIVIKESEDKE